MPEKEKNSTRTKSTGKIANEIPRESYLRFDETMAKVKPFIKPSLQKDTTSQETWKLHSSSIVEF